MYVLKPVFSLNCWRIQSCRVPSIIRYIISIAAAEPHLELIWLFILFRTLNFCYPFPFPSLPCLTYPILSHPIASAPNPRVELVIFEISDTVGVAVFDNLGFQWLAHFASKPAEWLAPCCANLCYIILCWPKVLMVLYCSFCCANCAVINFNLGIRMPAASPQNNGIQ